MDGSGVANRFYHEIELFDGSSGELVAWVKIPSLSSSVDTILYMYYGNLDCINQGCPKFVWDSNYVMVQHMKDSLDNSQIQDSTYYDNNGVKKGVNEPLEKESKIGKGQYFDGNDYIDISYSKWYPELGGMNALTLEAWVKPDSTSGYYHEVISAYRPTNMYYLSFGGWDHDQWVIKICSSSSCTSSYFGPEYPATGIWYYVVCSWDGINVSYFLDGNYEVGQYWNDGSINSGNQLIRIGAENSDYGEYLIGEISELRISNTSRNSLWIKTSYENQNSPSSFLSIGPEESGP
jgi:MSHA biogenesis protein MshQ